VNLEIEIPKYEKGMCRCSNAYTNTWQSTNAGQNM